MSTDIEKLAVFDGRIIQRRPAYAVQKGALSVTNAPFNSIAQTTSQHTYNIYVPSENVFVDRAITWSSTCTLAVTITNGAILPAGTPLFVPGRDFSLAAFPLNSLCSTMSATINDTTAVVNTQDVLYQVLRLADQKRNRLQRTCPTMLDKYKSYNDAFQTINNPIGAYDAQPTYDEAPNGAFQGLWFVDNTGETLAGTGAVPQAVAVPALSGAYNAINGIPVSNGAAAGPYIFNVQWRSTEKLVLSPFVFADEHEYDTGLFGINNIQLIMNLVSNPARTIRSTTRGGATITNIAYASGSGTLQPFQNSRINVQFLTPSLDVPLPPKSCVPYMEFPRYLSQSQTILAGKTAQIQSQTITLPQIPDLLVIFARKQDAYGFTEADFLLPVASGVGDGITNVPSNDVSPLSVNFDNFSGLLSSVTTQQLYEMSVRNGLEMDWDTWSGRAHTGSLGYGAGTSQVIQGQRIPLVGGPLVLKPGQDITLQSGQAPSLVGNFTLQFNLSVTNPDPLNPVNAQLVVITINSGFFESIRGSSRIIKGVLSEQDIISAPLAPMGSPQLERMVGGFSFSSLANVLSKAKSVYERTKPVISAIKGALPEEGMAGKVRGALGAVGYGAGASGGAMSGGRRRTLADRLM